MASASISHGTPSTTSCSVSASWSTSTTPQAGVITLSDGQQIGWMYSAGDIRYSLGGTFSGLTPSTDYSASIQVWDTVGFACSSSTSFRTADVYIPPPPTVGIPTINSISVNVNYILIDYTKGTNNSSVWYEITRTDGSDLMGGGGTSNPLSITVSYYNSSYRVRMQGYYNGTYSAWSGYTTFTTGSPPPPNTRPTSWAWSYNIASGSPVLSSTFSADLSTVTAYILTASEWKSFTDRIDAFRVYYGRKYGTGLTYYGSYWTVTSGAYCSNLIINNAIYAINAMGFNIPAIDNFSGIAGVLNNMKNTLNSIA